MELNVEQVRAAARSAQSLATQLGGVELVGPMDQVAGALPGARAEQAASSLENTWVQRVRNLADDVDAHADALRSSANRLQTVDGDQHDHLERYRVTGSARPTGTAPVGPGPTGAVPVSRAGRSRAGGGAP